MPISFASLTARVGLLATAVVLAAWAPAAFAQSGSDENEVEEKTLVTKDGVKLGVTYYRSAAGRDATPVVMLHDLKGSRANYHKFALRLQNPGRDDTHDSFAVVTVDLRGHGDSTEQNYRGGTRTIDSSKLRKNDYNAMVVGDMEAVRKLLVTENDANRLNVNRLAVIGAGMGASVAVNWTAVDWSVPQLPTVKQGQDIKALALISPRWKSGGMSMQKAMKVPGVQRQVSFLLMYGGEDRRVRADVSRIYGQLERGRDNPLEVPQGEKPPKELPSLVQFGPKTDLQGMEWLKLAGKNAEDLIIRFLEQQAVEPDFPHSKRRAM